MSCDSTVNVTLNIFRHLYLVFFSFVYQIHDTTFISNTIGSMRTRARNEVVYEEIPDTSNHYSVISTVHPESGTAHQQRVTDTELTDNIELTNNPAYGHTSTIPEGTQGEQHDYTYVL